jgi:hypothetical protein
MIGKISIGKSFRGCISYCLEDKKQELTEEQVMKNRAEILSYNLCFGNKAELIRQFNEVRQLNHKLSKPVLHITLSLAPGEKLPRGKLIEMIEDCAHHMGFERNQYLAVHHNDTKHQHIHIVANRVDLDGKTVKDSHNYKKIADYCRKMELKHELKQVLNPRIYLPKELRQIPRQDARKESLRQNIQQCLSTAHSYPDFEKQMREKGYQIIKARGISFLDKQKVKVKGSEVGYSLKTIEKLLELKPELRNRLLEQNEARQSEVLFINRSSGNEKLKESSQPVLIAKELKKTETLEQHKETHNALEILLRQERQTEKIEPHLLKKKKQRQSPHL